MQPPLGKSYRGGLRVYSELIPDISFATFLANNPEFAQDGSRRSFLRAAGILMAGLILPKGHAEVVPRAAVGTGHKVVVVVIGGVRRAETFSPDGLENIPHLSSDMLPKALFYPHTRNEGVTAHFNAISSILTG